MQSKQPPTQSEESKSSQGADAEPEIVMVPLTALKMVQAQLDVLNAAMHALSVRAVPVYKDHEDFK